jgi:pimeloyl-ACP methyl ester carboxylesterase
MEKIKIDYVVVAGVEMPIRSSAPNGRTGDSEAVVFVHGNPGSGEDWATFIPQVGEFSRVIAPDMPGYGNADRPKDFDYTIEGYARHLALVLEQLDIDKAHLVLHDFGGSWGLQFANDHPERVASMTMFNIGATPGYRWHKYALIYRIPILGELFQLFATRWAFRTLLNLDNPKPFPVEFTDRMFDHSDWGMSRGMLKLYRATPDIGKKSVELVGILKERSIPALVLWGEGDKYLPVSYASKQKDFYDVEVHTLPGCGHWPMIDEPELVVELLIPFLQRQRGGYVVSEDDSLTEDRSVETA